MDKEIAAEMMKLAAYILDQLGDRFPRHYSGAINAFGSSAEEAAHALTVPDRHQANAISEESAAVQRLSEAAPSIPPYLQSFYNRYSRSVAAGRVFAPTSDIELLYAATLVPPDPGRYSIFIHGDPYAARIGAMILPPDQLSTMIRGDPKWNSQPIRLVSCSSGKQFLASENRQSPYAQEIADELRVRVRAPDRTAWIMKSGRIVVSSKETDVHGRIVPREPPDGEWIDFDPRS